MGYYTQYALTVIEGDKDLIRQLREENENATYAINENGSTEESCKWYGHVEDMKKFSSEHPEALFMMEGEGEESGDLWIEYYKNGKAQRCKAKITYEEFNPEKLL